MRRGIGVAHVQKKTEIRRQMTDLGAQMTAERVGQMADELESFELHLRALAEKHKEEIKNDPIIRARFRQLADSLGIDLISSKKNLFAGILGLGDFYYGLASKVVEACMRERKFCGSYVPLERIVLFMKKQYNTVGNSGKYIDITEDDVRMALDKLHVLGDGYNVVKLRGVNYIQTTPDGVRGVDDVPLLNIVLEEQARQIANYRGSHVGAHSLLKPTSTPNDTNNGDINRENDDEDIPLEVQCVALRQEELERRLMWGPHRVYAVLERMVQNGSVWIEHKLMEYSPNVGKNLKQPIIKRKEFIEADRVYWFIGLVLQDEPPM